ncbi:MAG: hypothetical protein KAH05_00075 [Clostridiales bacterium]|nr:hypothetical protein [Clostridiales bacterium]
MFNDKRANLKAPRFRKEVEDTGSTDNLKVISEKAVLSRKYSISEIKTVIKTFNTLVWENVIKHRDGVSLPESLGDIFVGTCPPKKLSKNVDYKSTLESDTVVQHRNYESDSYLAKIFYTTYNLKRKYKNGDVWGFKASRNFSRSVSKAYPVMWKMYYQIDPRRKVSEMFRSMMFETKIKQFRDNLILDYNEFEF